MRSYAPILGVFLVAIVAGVVYLRIERAGPSPGAARRDGAVGCSQVRRVFGAHDSGIWVSLSGRATRLLPDAVAAYRHQRFIVSCPAGLTILIVNDVSIGQRVPISPGDRIIVHGLYVWNALGGLIHFTHHDPGGGEGGWIFRQGTLYSLGVTGTGAVSGDV